MRVRTAKVREAVVDVLARSPGLTPAELSAALGVKKSTLHYHLAALEAEGRICSKAVGRHRVLRLDDAFGPEAVAAPARRRILDVVFARPGIHLAEVARAVGTSRSTVHHHVTLLEAAGLVRVERGVVARCWPTTLTRASTSRGPVLIPLPCPRSPPSR